jgi:hypothetical protein
MSYSAARISRAGNDTQARWAYGPAFVVLVCRRTSDARVDRDMLPPSQPVRLRLSTCSYQSLLQVHTVPAAMFTCKRLYAGVMAFNAHCDTGGTNRHKYVNRLSGRLFSVRRESRMSIQERGDRRRTSTNSSRAVLDDSPMSIRQAAFVLLDPKARERVQPCKHAPADHGADHEL